MGGGRVVDPAPPARGADIVAGARLLASALGEGPDRRAEALLAILARHGFAPQRVIIEMTEREMQRLLGKHGMTVRRA